MHEVVPFEDVLGRGYQYFVVSPELGISYKFSGNRFSVSYRRNFIYGGTANLNLRFAQFRYRGTGSDFDEIERVNLYLHLRRPYKGLRLGMGYFRKTWSYPPYFYTNGVARIRYQGLDLSVVLNFKEVCVEFVKQIDIAQGGIDVFSTYLYGVSVYRNFSLKREGEKDLDRVSWDHFFPFVSLRVQPVKYHYSRDPILFHPVGFVPGLGLGYYFPKYDASLIVSRDVWKRIAGGTLTNDVIGYISTTNIMLKKYFEGKRNGKWVVGLGWHPIRNDNEPWRIDSVVLIDAQTGNEVIHTFPRYTNVFGIGYSIGYALDEHYELEFRQIVPYFGDKAFTPWYSGIGVVYNFREEGF